MRSAQVGRRYLLNNDRVGRVNEAIDTDGVAAGHLGDGRALGELDGGGSGPLIAHAGLVGADREEGGARRGPRAAAAPSSSSRDRVDGRLLTTPRALARGDRSHEAASVAGVAARGDGDQAAPHTALGSTRNGQARLPRSHSPPSWAQISRGTAPILSRRGPRHALLGRRASVAGVSAYGGELRPHEEALIFCGWNLDDQDHRCRAQHVTRDSVLRDENVSPRG